MGYRAFNDKTSIADAQRSTVYTVEALAVHPDRQVAALASPLERQLRALPALLTRSQETVHEIVRASARVSVWDGVLDDAFREFGKDVLGAVRQDRTAKLYRAIYGDQTPTDLIELSLAPEVEEAQRIIEVLNSGDVPAALKRTWATRLNDLATKGASLLAERKDARAADSAAAEEIARWIERTDRARRAVDGALTQFAAARDLPRDFNDRFFPAVAASPRKKSAAPRPAPVAPPATPVVTG